MKMKVEEFMVRWSKNFNSQSSNFVKNMNNLETVPLENSYKDWIETWMKWSELWTEEDRDRQYGGI